MKKWLQNIQPLTDADLRSNSLCTEQGVRQGKLFIPKKKRIIIW